VGTVEVSRIAEGEVAVTRINPYRQTNILVLWMGGEGRKGGREGGTEGRMDGGMEGWREGRWREVRTWAAVTGLRAASARFGAVPF
jgi:hypothetical protein